MLDLRGPSVHGDERGSVVTIGVFDGVHRGHLEVLSSVVEQAQRAGVASAVVTFDPPPLRVLAPERATGQLETLSRRLARLEDVGIDEVRVIDFDDAASKESASDFVTRVLVGELGARAVVIGSGFRFGHGRAGDIALLGSLGEEHGFTVREVAPVGEDERFSSTAARRAVEAGHLVEAQAILGHPVVMDGVVVRGDARGTTLGFPTANVAWATELVRPAEGVYAGAACTHDGHWYAAAISIGRRPQFYEDGDVLVEAYLLDFAGTLYGQPITLVLLAHLRAEERFTSTIALVTQITADVEETRRRFRPFSEKPELLLGFSTGRRR